MKKCSMKKIIALILAFAVTFSFFQAGNIADAKGGKTWYCAKVDGTKSGIKKVSLKGNKLTIWGSFAKGSSYEKCINAYCDGKKTKYAKKTFTLSKNVEIYTGGGGDPISEYTPKEFYKAYLKEPNIGLELEIIVKNGKVIEMSMTS